MQLMFFHKLGPHRLESSQSHVQRNLSGLDPALSHARQNFGGEMQPRRGSRDRSAFSRIHRLVALAVARRIISRNVWRQRNVTDLFQQRKERLRRRGIGTIWEQPSTAV